MNYFTWSWSKSVKYFWLLLNVLLSSNKHLASILFSIISNMFGWKSVSVFYIFFGKYNLLFLVICAALSNLCAAMEALVSCSHNFHSLHRWISASLITVLILLSRMMGSHYMILFHTISRYFNIFKPSVRHLLKPVWCGLSLDCWFCSTMMLMEKEEMMEVMIIWAGIVVTKVGLNFDACSLIYFVIILALMYWNLWGLEVCCQLYGASKLMQHFHFHAILGEHVLVRTQSTGVSAFVLCRKIYR